MQYHERYHHKKVKEKQDALSDTEYVLPRVGVGNYQSNLSFSFSLPVNDAPQKEILFVSQVDI